MKVTVSRLPSSIGSGDWHDRPLRWMAKGPGREVQHFSTRKEADAYARIRRASGSEFEAVVTFALPS